MFKGVFAKFVYVEKFVLYVACVLIVSVRAFLIFGVRAVKVVEIIRVTVHVIVLIRMSVFDAPHRHRKRAHKAERVGIVWSIHTINVCIVLRLEIPIVGLCVLCKDFGEIVVKIRDLLASALFSATLLTVPALFTVTLIALALVVICVSALITASVAGNEQCEYKHEYEN